MAWGGLQSAWMLPGASKPKKNLECKHVLLALLGGGEHCRGFWALGTVEPVDTRPSGTIKANKQSNPLSLGAFQTKGIKGGNEELESEERGLGPRGWLGVEFLGMPCGQGMGRVWVW